MKVLTSVPYAVGFLVATRVQFLEAMADPNTEPAVKKKTTVTPEEIARFLEQTGFVFEMRMSEVFQKAEYKTEISAEFFDLEKDVEREIDILATKRINDIDVHFVVECKQSATDKWVFICNKRMVRLYYAIKHLPQIELSTMRLEDPFGAIHYYDRRVPLGHNYLCYTIIGGKKAEHKQIDECVYKLPKALISKAANAGSDKRHLFFPVGLFSGQIFAAAYQGKLIVKEQPFLQYSTSLSSEAYRRDQRESDFSDDSNWIDWAKEQEQAKIRTTASNLRHDYSIDFVSAAGLADYLAMVEEEVESIDLEKWPLPEKAKNRVETAAGPGDEIKRPPL